MITYSEDVSSYFRTNIDYENNSETSPTGTQNAAKLTTTNTLQCHTRSSFTASSTGNYVGSVFLKKQDFNYIYTELGGAYAWFNIGNGTIGNSGNYGSDWTYVSHSIEDYGNGWYRCVIIGNCLNTGTYTYRPVQMVSDNSSYNSNLIGGVTYLFGTQLEQASYDTSYIPTNGSTVTRLADVCNNAGSSDLINSTEGVLYAEIAALADDGINKRISISNGTTSNVVTIELYPVPNLIVVRLLSNSVQQAFLVAGNINKKNYNKIAIKYKENDCALWVNGTEVSVDTSAASPVGLSELAFDDGGGGDKFYGNVKCVAVFKEALSDTELAKLTQV